MLAFKTIREDVSNFVNSSIFIQEGYLTVKNIINEDERIHAYQLRHKIFCDELKWVANAEDRLEVDSYDHKAIFFGIFDGQDRLLAFLRLIMPEGVFMLEKEFLSLVGPAHIIRKQDDTAEVSRLCVANEARNNVIHGDFGIFHISMLLYKGVYHWCIRKNIRYLYLVVEKKIYRLLRLKGFPCKLIGEPRVMPDDVVAVAAIIDWREFEIFNAIERPQMLSWFTQYQSIPGRWQVQQPESCLQHQAFA